MIQIRTMRHIPTSQMIPGAKTIAAWGRSHHRSADWGRIQSGFGQMKCQESRRVWLNHQWAQNPSQRRSP